MSLAKQLLEKFKTRPGDWIPGGAIEKWVSENTENTPSYARREIRKMVEEGLLKQEERVHKGTNHAWYSFNPENTPVKPRYEYVYDPYKKAMIEKLVR